MKNISSIVQNKLLDLRDIKYRDFHASLVPNLDKNSILGVRTPVLRKYAKEFAKTDESKRFINHLPHKYYDENNLHCFIISEIKDFGEALKQVELFLPYVDNWATCDSLSPKAFKKNLPELFKRIKIWLKSKHTYTVRFGVEMLMKFYLDEDFNEEYPKLVAKIKSDEYYINMMIAWYFATALAKQAKTIMPYFSEKRLSEWCHNKAIQKCIESYRIPEETKKILRNLRE